MIRKRNKWFIASGVALLMGAATISFWRAVPDKGILSFTVDARQNEVRLYWKDDGGQLLRSLQNLKTLVESRRRTLLFATNGGMFNADRTPHGLYIEQGKQLAPLDVSRGGDGNFYLQPNGVFYLTKTKVPVVCATRQFANLADKSAVQYATQSGPMLVIDGKINSNFRRGSENLNIRSGVGVLPNGKIVFALSKSPVNFYDFARYFQRLGCRNVLYLDGFVSRAYYPAQKWTQSDGDFGVLIGVTTSKH